MTTMLKAERASTRSDAACGSTQGTSSPLGATPCREGVNFSLFSRHATGVELLLFDHVDDAKPAHTIRIDPATHRTYHYWHVFVPELAAGQLYGYRVEGPWDPASGMRFDPTKVLLDPYGHAVAVPDGYGREAARGAGDNGATAMKSVVVDPSAYDWEGDQPLRRPSARTIIYEMHVRGFTRCPSSGIGEKARGTFAGLIEKIPYLQQLVSRIAFAAALALAAPGLAQAAETRQVAEFGPNPGHLRMYERVPDGLPAGAPLVVALHGCTQSAAAFDDDSGWAGLADRFRFALLLPEQQKANNDALCFNFFRDEDNRRGQGEAASIRSMIATMVAKHGLDPSRVHVTGLSAGGAMTAVMLAAYPDVFAAGAIIAGLPYGCASTGGNPVLEAYRMWYVWNPYLGEAAWAASRCGISRGVPPFPPAPHDPDEWRQLALEAGGADHATHGWPNVSIWQGGADRTVYPSNLGELVEQWTALHGIDRKPDQSETGPTYRHDSYADAAGVVEVEAYELPKLGHAVPVDPGTSPEQCGIAADEHFEDEDVCAALRIARFWGIAIPPH